jgi:uncharacterized protein
MPNQLDLTKSTMIDIHVHFFPPALFQAIWRYFETPGHGLWKVKYKMHGRELINTLKNHGVRCLTTLVYAHKPGLADYLNNFVHESVSQYPELIPFGTIFAGDGRCGKVAKTIFEDYEFIGIKLHPFVSKEHVDDIRFSPVYEIMQDLGKVLVCHTGSVPVYNCTDGAIRVRKVLNQFPKLKVIIAHCGAYEYRDYHSLVKDFEFVYFDTAMNCVHNNVFSNNCPGRGFFIEHQDRILFGSDFPNIPYEYSYQVEAIKKLELGESVERKIFNDNAVNLLDL